MTQTNVSVCIHGLFILVIGIRIGCLISEKLRVLQLRKLSINHTVAYNLCITNCLICFFYYYAYSIL